MNIVVSAYFINEDSKLLLEYERVANWQSVTSVRLLSETNCHPLIANEPCFHAVWLYRDGKGVLSPKQLMFLEDLLYQELHEGHQSISDTFIEYN